MRSHSPSIKKSRWIPVFVLSLVFLSDFLLMNFLGALSTYFLENYRFAHTGFSTLGATYFICLIVFLIPAGRLLDKSSFRLIFISVCVGFLSSSTLYLYTPTIVSLYIARALSGTCGAFCLLGGIKYVSCHFQGHDRGKPISCILSTGLFGGILAHTTLPMLFTHFGYQYAAAFVVFISFICLCLVLIFIKSNSYMVKTDTPQENNIDISDFIASLKRAFFSMYKEKILHLTFVAAILNGPFLVFGSVWGQQFVKYTLQSENDTAAYVTSFIFWGMFIGTFVTGYLYDIVTRLTPFFVVSGLLNSILLLSEIYFKMGIYGSMVLFFCMGFFCSLHTTIYPFASQKLPFDDLGIYNGSMSTIIMAIAPFYQIIYGVIIDAKELVCVSGFFGNTLKVYHFLAAGIIILSLFTAALWTLKLERAIKVIPHKKS